MFTYSCSTRNAGYFRIVVEWNGYSNDELFPFTQLIGVNALLDACEQTLHGLFAKLETAIKYERERAKNLEFELRQTYEREDGISNFLIEIGTVKKDSNQ